MRPLDAKPTWRQFSIPLPPDEEVAEVALSPGGDRLAWLMSRLMTGFRMSGRQDRHPFTAEIGIPWWSFWLSELDGHGMAEIGGLLSSTAGLFNLAWTPSGRQLSFSYSGRDWTIPVSVAGQRGLAGPVPRITP